MGNNPSSASKPATPVSSTPASAYGSPRNSKRDSKHHSIPPRTTQRVAAPPEASLQQAQGSTINKGPKPLQSIPISGIASSSPSSSSNYQPISPPSGPPVSSTSSSHKDTTNPRDEPSKPVDVPISNTESSSLRSHASASAHAVDHSMVSQSSVTDMSYLTRPPRLPLPIEEEVHTPGSPIDDIDVDAHAISPVNSAGESMTRKSSALSNATVDDDDSEELMVDKTRPTVPTRLEWRRGGDKIYVTGSIFHWNRKQRLHPVDGKPGVFAGTVHILPGTHHVRFLVDGMMQTSPELPTTVDFGNNLVNYIEISADDLRTSSSGTKQAVTGGQPAPAKGKQQPAIEKPETETSQAGGAEAKTTSEAPDEQAKPLLRGRSVPSPSQYFDQIPKYLVDFDQSEESPAYQHATQAIDKLSHPPSLPGFLGKPILNAAVLMKDDNSVLNMPNHTVLNHLATSSIKNNILAVSATTRYKNKYVTTIVYKPTSSEE